ncbi:MAG: XdhC family protein [Rectinema sp.]|nr:XdhC family protein [Rectinema sp.]
MNPIRDWIRQRLREKRPLVLAAVVETTGSTARTTDALMAFDADGTIAGTVGGGYVEAQSLEAARRLIEKASAEESCPALDLEFDLTPETHKTRMICGGRLTIHEALFKPDTEETAALLACLDHADRGKPAGLVVFHDSNDIRALMVDAEDRIHQFGSARAGIALMERLSTSHPAFGTAARISLGSEDLLEADRGTQAFWLSFMPDPVLYVFGAGHVGKAVADIACMVGFRVYVIDDRADMLTTARFPRAEVLRLIRNFDDALAGDQDQPALQPGPSDSALVLTRRPDIDKCVLAQLLSTNVGYLGLIGSKGKRDGIYEQLRLEGFSDRDLERVHCPVGLPIGARTPEEIAISILAEIIATRSGALT